MKSATKSLIGVIKQLKVSIHAPVKSATRYRKLLYFPISCFNPRAREERDDFNMEFEGYILVSIHAPVKSATVILLAD